MYLILYTWMVFNIESKLALLAHDKAEGLGTKLEKLSKLMSQIRLHKDPLSLQKYAQVSTNFVKRISIICNAGESR